MTFTGRIYLMILAMSFLALGCEKESASFSLLRAGQSFQSNNGGAAFNNKVDILFVVNDQPSMSSFQAELVASMGSFMSIFETKGFDFKIAVVTSAGFLADPTLAGYSAVNVDQADFNEFDGAVHSNMPVIIPTDPNLYKNFSINAKPQKNSAGQDGRAFSSFRQALKNTRPYNAGFLRPGSYLAVIIVDNQEDFSGNGRCVGCNMNLRYAASTLDTVTTYIDFLNTLTGTSGSTARYNVSAMTQIAKPCQGGTTMTRIMDIVTKTNGVLGDICQANFGASMAAISTKIAVLSTQYFLDRTPIISSINVSINSVVIPQSSTNGWSYNTSANSIQFNGSAIPPQDSVIVVNFDPVTVQQ